MKTSVKTLVVRNTQHRSEILGPHMAATLQFLTCYQSSDRHQAEEFLVVSVTDASAFGAPGRHPHAVARKRRLHVFPSVGAVKETRRQRP